jgi:hypothetical protein
MTAKPGSSKKFLSYSVILGCFLICPSDSDRQGAHFLHTLSCPNTYDIQRGHNPKKIERVFAKILQHSAVRINQHNLIQYLLGRTNLSDKN